MPVKYISISDKVSEDNEIKLINDFVQSTNDKYIVIKKVRLINNNGQLDIGCCLCGNFAEDSSYSYGLFDDGHEILRQNFAPNYFAPKIF